MPKGQNQSNPDCTILAAGYGKINVPVVTVDYGMTVVATEDMGRFNRIFYPMQVQLDMFSISAIFATKPDSNAFNRWIWQYVEFASDVQSGIAPCMRVQVPARNFDMMGFPVQGWSYHFAPVQLTDVTWVVTINFDGASPAGGQKWLASASAFGAAPQSNNSSGVDQEMWYPSYYDGGPSQSSTFTGDPSDAMYRKPKAVPTPVGELRQTVTKLPPRTTGVFPTDKQYLKPIGPGLNGT